LPLNIEIHDELTIWRCPTLGGPVPFVHCRKTNNGFPCFSIVTCWGERVDLAAFLRENYTMEELEQAFGAAKKSRLETILDTLEKARSEKT
jgi:hypothetical protein